MNLVTIYKAFNSADAQLVRLRLEAAGFHPFVADEEAALILDGIRVQLAESEFAAAREFLDAP